MYISICVTACCTKVMPRPSFQPSDFPLPHYPRSIKKGFPYPSTAMRRARPRTAEPHLSPL